MVMLSADDLSKIIDKFADMKYEQGRQAAIANMKPLTLEDAAAFLQVNVSTINRWMKSGDITFHRMGSKPYFYKDEIIGKMKNEKINY